MSIPSEVKIGWRTYKIEQGAYRSNDDGRSVVGEIYYEKNTIYIYKHLTEEEKQAVLLHEIIHGCLWLMGSGLVSNERLIKALSEHLYQVLKENPALISCLAQATPVQ